MMTGAVIAVDFRVACISSSHSTVALFQSVANLGRGSSLLGLFGSDGGDPGGVPDAGG